MEESLPNYPIHVLGPAPTSGTYDVLMGKINGTCGPYLRHDGAYVEAPTNENLIIQKVLNAKQTVGIVTFSYFEKNQNRLTALAINGIKCQRLIYPVGILSVSRELYLYIKTNVLAAHPSPSLVFT